MKNVFFVPEESRWSFIMQNAKQNDIALKIDTALNTIEKQNPSLKGALPDNYYSRLGIDVSKLAALLDEINNIQTNADKENLSSNGTAGFLLANGALSGEGQELEIRKQLIENNLVEAIVILPRNLFYTTDISVTLWILNKNKKSRTVEQNGKIKNYRNREDEVLFMDLRQMGSPFEKKYIELTQEDRDKVTTTFHSWQQAGANETYKDIPEFCYSANKKEIVEKGYNLVPSRYIEFVNRDETQDYDSAMKALQSELTDLLKEEEESKKELLGVFKDLGYEIKL